MKLLVVSLIVIQVVLFSLSISLMFNNEVLIGLFNVVLNISGIALNIDTLNKMSRY